MKIVDINTLKGSDRHGSCVECEKDFTEDKGMKRIIFGTDQKRTIFLCLQSLKPMELTHIALMERWKAVKSWITLVITKQ